MEPCEEADRYYLLYLKARVQNQEKQVQSRAADFQMKCLERGWFKIIPDGSDVSQPVPVVFIPANIREMYKKLTRKLRPDGADDERKQEWMELHDAVYSGNFSAVKRTFRRHFPEKVHHVQPESEEQPDLAEELFIWKERLRKLEGNSVYKWIVDPVETETCLDLLLENQILKEKLTNAKKGSVEQ